MSSFSTKKENSAIPWFITADEARKDADEYHTSNNNEHFTAIMTKIRHAKDRGEYSTGYPSISEPLQQKLKKLGFEIEFDQGYPPRDPSYWKISWKRR